MPSPNTLLIVNLISTWYMVGLTAVPAWTVFAALGLLAIVWASTAFVQVPCHEKLSDGFDAAVHGRLVLSNWIRTVCWTARGLLVTWMLALVMNEITRDAV